MLLTCCLPQVFSVLVAAASLAGFAIVLALVEQAVLEVIENNVNQGSTVFEKDHVSDWLGQACHALLLHDWPCTSRTRATCQ